MELCLYILVIFSLTAVQAITCGAGSFSIGGSYSVLRLAQAWKEAYVALCPGATITISPAEDSAAAAARVCGTRANSTPVDVGGMTRAFIDGEGTSDDGWRVDCELSTRKAILVDLALEGVSVLINSQGVAADCIDQMKGLTLDQLRWIFSNYTEQQLSDNGWDPGSVPNSDGLNNTHLWRELFSRCAPVEIAILGDSGAERYFEDVIFTGSDEGFDTHRPSGYYSTSNITELINHIKHNDTSIAFMGLSYILSTEVRSRNVALTLVAIQNQAGQLILPSSAAFEDDVYALSRRLHFALLNDTNSLNQTRPFLDFGLSPNGTDIIKGLGYWPFEDWEILLARTRAQTASGISLDYIQKACGPSGSNISMAGSDTVFPISRLWAAIYDVGCEYNISVEAGGSSFGTARVCNKSASGTPVDIGDISRQWEATEAIESKGFLYKCLFGDLTRSAVEVDVAIDGITVAYLSGGTAEACIKILGGLTIDQLRWMYSDYNDVKLQQTGWNPASLKNSDQDSSTHLWSELDNRCPVIEIRIGGSTNVSGTYAYFAQTVFKDYANGETFDVNRPLGYESTDDYDSLVAYLKNYDEAIAYFGYAYYYENQATLDAIPIQNDKGVFVAPTVQSISDGSYNPFSRRLYMNLWNEANSIKETVPFVKFGLSTNQLVTTTGYVPLPDSDTATMMSRLEGAPYSANGSSSGSGSGLSKEAKVWTTIGAIVLVILHVLLIRRRVKRIKKKKKEKEEREREAAAANTEQEQNAKG